jgi:hypothetical protein
MNDGPHVQRRRRRPIRPVGPRCARPEWVHARILRHGVSGEEGGRAQRPYEALRICAMDPMPSGDNAASAFVCPPGRLRCDNRPSADCAGVALRRIGSARWSPCPAEGWVVATSKPPIARFAKQPYAKSCAGRASEVLAEPCGDGVSLKPIHARSVRTKHEHVKSHDAHGGRLPRPLSAAIGAGRPWLWRSHARPESRHRRRRV